MVSESVPIIITIAIVFTLVSIVPRAVTEIIRSQSFPGWPRIDAVIVASTIEEFHITMNSINRYAPWIYSKFVVCKTDEVYSYIQEYHPWEVSVITDVSKEEALADYFIYFRQGTSLTKKTSPADFLYFIDSKTPYGFIIYIDGYHTNNALSLLFDSDKIPIISHVPQIRFKGHYALLESRMQNVPENVLEEFCIYIENTKVVNKT
jgi:hypothetical protein